MRIRLFIVLTCVFSLSKGNAQKVDIGKVSVAALEEKVHPIDTSAVAAIVFNKARTFFSYDPKDGFSINTENTFRIKIYKKEGLKWANYKLPYRIGYENLNDDRVEFSDCYTYNLENGKVVKTKLASEGTFKTAINKYWKEAAIAMPNVNVGSIVEFKYLLKSENIVEFPAFNFQQDIFVNYSEYTTQIPGFFVYKAVAKRSSELIFDSKEEGGSLSYTLTDGSQRTESVSFRQAKNTYSAYNISALKEEPFVDNIENYRLSVIHELEKTQFYQEPVKNYSMTWEGVAKTIYEDKDFGKELEEREYLRQDLSTILKGIESPDERLDKIFRFVQHKMNWNKKRGYYVDKGVKQAYSDGTGNNAEINFILISMLNYAGIKASPVLISTIDNGIPVFPNRTIFNYVIAAVEMDGKQILLDAADKNTTQNIIPLYAINWTGRLINQDGSTEEVKLIPNNASKKSTNLMTSIDDSGKMSGKYKTQRTDYEAFSFRNEYSGINQQNYLERFENEHQGIQISEYSIENDKDLAKPVMETFTFTTDNECEVIGDKMYINPKLFFTQSQNPFVQEKRYFPIYFGVPSQEKFNINIAIPDGYAVESIPKPIKLQTVDNMVSFVFNIEISNNNIQIAIIEACNSQYVALEYYADLKDFYKQMIDKQNEKIVLKKI
jgi:transglutaminase-like putative cysteine protease